MIQRIQSVYLFLTTLLSLLFLNGSFFNFIDKTESVIKVTFSGIVRDTGGQGFEPVEKVLPISVFIVLIPILSFITIFIFKNRKIQLWFALSEIILIVGFIFFSIFYSWIVITEYGAEIVPGLKMVIPVLMLIFTVLAYRGIRHDDRLIKSNDRLR